jgi:hypothetical protein
MRKDIGNTYNGWLQGFMDRELATYFAAGAAGRARNVLGRVVEGGRSRRMANKRKVGKRKTEKRKTRKTMKRR